ncbi:CbtA family protein [Chthonobacter rhizosphaerae]|uniref:CbtA family protein n=1 Tax=Chthonobacter rhizosphaerae TaxID=2735553 RepID=UPI0015EFCCE1|nr:CbtA family protein [Chthonobacter rhizosphaerae]
MLKRVLSAACAAGLAAGLATAALQHVTTVPLILEAERYETAVLDGWSAPEPGLMTAVAAHGDAAPGHAHGEGVQAHGGGDHAHGGWSPADGLERTLATTVATVVSGIGFALVLIAVLLLAGERITARTALAYAVGGFAATGLATGVCLAPELPGSAAAGVEARQLWWIGTAAATAAGLYLILKTRHAAALPLGLALLVVPHLVGAPHPDGYTSTVPAEIAARFAATSLAVHAAFWAAVGLGVGILWQRGEPRAAA